MTELLFCLEILGVISFAVSGAMVAIDNECDLFGVVFLSITTCFGGGIIRDVIIDDGSKMPWVFTSDAYLLVSLSAFSAVAVFIIAVIFKKKYVKNERVIEIINNYFDAVGIGIFAVSGAKVCMDAGVNSLFAIVCMGIISCIGGSMIRDFALNIPPFFLRKRIYCVAVIIGVLVYYLLYKNLEVPEVLAMTVGAALVSMIRILATVFKLSIPKAIIFSQLRDDGEKK